MTTQHTHPEFGDVDARDVVEQHAPDMQETPDEVTSSTASTQVEQAAQLQQQEDTSSPPALPPLTIPSLLSFTVSNASPTSSPSDEGETADVQDVQILSLDEQLPLEPAPLHLAHDIAQEQQGKQEEQETPVTSVASNERDESTVRPFVEYYEEFRQSEARTLSEAPDAFDAFSEFSQSATAMPPLADEVVELETEPPNEKVLPPFDFGEGSSFIPAEVNPANSAIVNANDAAAQSPMDAAITEEQQRASAAGQEENAQPARPERPASPLLRPANRHRPRHGTARHREEFVRSQGNEMPVTEPTPVQPTNDTQEQQVQEAQQLEEATSVETPVETPKPPRRYRFDRPAAQGTQRIYSSPAASTAATSSSTSATPVVATPSENAPATQEAQTTAVSPIVSAPQVSHATTTNEAGDSTPIDVSTRSTTSQEEQALKREAATIERSAATNGMGVPAEQGRRKHGQDHQQERQREKEQQETSSASAPQTPTTSVSDIAALVAETHDALQSDAAPEDLPPLEYADLQKANSRRRRRHRNGQNGTTATPAKAQETQAQETSATQPQNTQAAPTMPAASQNAPSATPLSQPATPPYSLTSGMTLNQMNQGNDVAGPFMGPEPSPARGSVFTRSGRTTRAETMRTPSYPSRERDNGVSAGPSSASMNHFANVIAQAIQMQSDRLVAELRSANQGPTNVSVSLPPFPSTERVGVFVDVANLLYSARTMRISIDFGKLLNFLRGNRRLVRAHAYCPTSPQPSDEQMFLQAVKGLGYRITTKNYKTFASGAKKADLDLDLCMDVVRLVDGRAVDCIVLVSGDSDFMPMLDYCSDHGVRVEIAAFDEAMSATLRQSCDMFINLAMLEEIRA